jgi:hypothetical protein
VALFLGILVIAELMFLLNIVASYFGLLENIKQLQTFTFQMLIYVELLDLLTLRERRHFWNSGPSRFLLLTITVDLAIVFMIAVFGLPGIAPISPTTALTVVGLSGLIVFLINDPIKVVLTRKFWPGS